MDDQDLKQFMTKSLCESVKEIFSTVLSLTPVLKEGTYIRDVEECIISSIGFTDKIEGNISICCSRKSACFLISKIAGRDFNKISIEVCDGLGEIVHAILKGVKIKALSVGIRLNISAPIAVSGTKLHIMAGSRASSRIVLDFVCEEEIWFSVCLAYKEPIVEEEVESVASTGNLNSMNTLTKALGGRGSCN